VLNKVIIIGNLGGDPESKFLPDGTQLTKFNVGTSYGYGTKKVAIWFRVTAWRKTAEACAKYLVKGSKVYVEGNFTNEAKPYQRKDGTWACSYELSATDVKFLSAKTESHEDSASSDEEISF
jgi:single-strand DNA-binding protein